MKTEILLPLAILATSPGCLNLSQTIRDLPGYEFEELNYTRGGNVTSTTINAANAKIEGDVLHLGSVAVSHSNPLFTVNANIKGLKRPAKIDRTAGASNTGGSQ